MQQCLERDSELARDHAYPLADIVVCTLHCALMRGDETHMEHAAGTLSEDHQGLLQRACTPVT